MNRPGALHSTGKLKETMQATMDEYVGRIGAHYRFSDQSLCIADGQIRGLQRQTELLSAPELQELVCTLELLEWLTLYHLVVAHLGARKETRWHSFAEYIDYPKSSVERNCYASSRLENDGLSILLHLLMKEGETYRH